MDHRQESANPPEGMFNEIGGAAMAAVLHILRLTAAELVLIRGTDLAQFEKAANAKLDQFTSPTMDPHAREAGLACARYLINQVITPLIRAQAELKRCLSVSGSAGTNSDSVTSSSDHLRLLN
jgi:hypothetical protein